MKSQLKCLRNLFLETWQSDTIIHLQDACVCSVVSDFATPWTATLQAPLCMGFPRQEHWSGWPLPPPGDLPDPGIEPMSLALAGGFFTTERFRKF